MPLEVLGPPRGATGQKEIQVLREHKVTASGPAGATGGTRCTAAQGAPLEVQGVQELKVLLVPKETLVHKVLLFLKGEKVLKEFKVIQVLNEIQVHKVQQVIQVDWSSMVPLDLKELQFSRCYRSSRWEQHMAQSAQLSRIPRCYWSTRCHWSVVSV